MKKFYYMVATGPDAIRGFLIQDCIEADNQIEAYRIVRERYPNASITPMDEPFRGDGSTKCIDTGLGSTATT